MGNRRNERAHREVVVAMLYAAEHPTEVIRVCTSIQGDVEALRLALMDEFGFSEMQVDAVIAMPVRHLTPHRAVQMREELARAEQRLSE